MKHATDSNGISPAPMPAFDAFAANAQRISTARHAILAAAWARGVNPAICDKAVIDLLADLMHFCKARRVDFDRCVRIAGDHFTVEIAGGAS